LIKKIVANALVVGIMFLAAVLIEITGNEPIELKKALIVGAIGYAAVSFFMLFVFPLYQRIRLTFDSAVDDKARSRAYEELLKLKRLLEEKIISQEEFDSRIRELKSKILQQR